MSPYPGTCAGTRYHPLPKERMAPPSQVTRDGGFALNYGVVVVLAIALLSRERTSFSSRTVMSFHMATDFLASAG